VATTAVREGKNERRFVMEARGLEAGTIELGRLHCADGINVAEVGEKRNSLQNMKYEKEKLDGSAGARGEGT